MRHIFNKKNKGFTVLFAVIVSALVLAIGISIANITLKQIRISSLGRESQIAFYGADSGAECVMYYDLVGDIFATSSNSNPTDTTINCFGETVEVLFEPSDAFSDRATSTIVINNSGAEANLCATVEIGKYDTNGDTYTDKTIILSRGYNVCTGDSTRLLERGIRIRY
jgi:Tfp pilus assembly protein PilX